MMQLIHLLHLEKYVVDSEAEAVLYSETQAVVESEAQAVVNSES